MASNDTNRNNLQKVVFEERSREASKVFCHPPPGEDVVITGMAGKFPESDDVYQFRENLFNGVDLITEDNRRWKPTNSEVPQRTGKLNDLSAFDAGFFGISSRHSNNIDVYVRMLLERTYEVIMDAGYHPSELAGTKTGVFISAGYSDSENYILYHKHVVNSSSMTGVIRSAIANHISYFFRLQGPSLIIDSGCSAALSAIEHAYRHIRQGICDMVIVGGINLCLHPNPSLTFARIGVLSSDGRCKTFDNNADGFARSETVTALFLQKSKDARRIYAHILHSKLNCDGYKPQGIAYPSSQMQTVLMKEVYEECNVELSDVGFIEAHGTATKVGDLQELIAFTDVFCSERGNPLYIGAVKSNAGHAEPAAALLSTVKVVLALECGFLPPNLNFTQPRKDVEALVDGRLKVITEKTAWPNEKGIAGVNSLGIGGVNGHLVLRWNEKRKRDLDLTEDNLPRLVCASGRTRAAVNTIWEDLSNRCLDIEFVNLLNTIFEKHTSNHPFRGYQILSKVGELKRSVNEAVGDKNKLVWIFNNFESEWPKVGKQLMVFPVFVKALERIQNIVTPIFEVDVIELLETFAQGTTANQILATMVFQICLASLLKGVELIPDILIGLGTGELIVAYLEDYLTLDEVICAHLFVDITFCNNKNKCLIDAELRNHLQNLKLNRHDRFQKWIPLHQRKQITHFHKQGSPEYFARNITEPFSFDEVKELLSSDCDVLVIGGQIKDFEHLSLIRNDPQDSVLNFLSTLGRLYEKGHDLHLNNLFAETAWPVSRGTPMISPLIKWNHSQEWFVAFYENLERIKCGQHTVWVDMKSKDWNFVIGHDIDGRILFPATGFLFLVWETLAKINQKATSDMKVVFENVKFLQLINLTNQDNIKLLISISEVNNSFQVSQRDDLIVTGTIYEEFDTREEFQHFLTIEYPKKKITLKQAEIYRKLRIRGYSYKGEFKAIHNVTGKENGLIEWTGNWITFMDNMLQMSVLYEESRNLCLPSSIKQIIIDPTVHSKFVDKGTLIPVRAYYDLGIVRSGGIQFIKMKGNSVARKKPRDPVLETHKFIPNATALSSEQSVRVVLQIILENNRITKFKSVEIAGNSKLISPYMKQALDDISFVQAEVTVLSKNSLDLPGITVEDKSINEKDNLHLMVLSHALEKGKMLYDALISVNDTSGYILTKESLNFEVLTEAPYGLEVLCVHNTNSEILVLLRKPNSWRQPSTINVSNDFMWLPTAQDAVKRGQSLILFSQNRFTDGILGLVNCLRKEANGDCVSCFFIIDDAPEFNPNHPFYEKQIRKNMAVNVWKAGEWGTYRYLPLKDNPVIQCEACYANVIVPGELSSIKFTEGNPRNTHQLDDEMQMIYVYWSALNFRDVLIATRRIPTEVLGRSRSVQECLLGVEFSGRDIT